MNFTYYSNGKDNIFRTPHEYYDSIEGLDFKYE